MEDISVKIAPAWEGRIQTGKSTELGVRIISSQGGDFLLTLKGGDLITHHTGALEADIPLDLWAPVRPVSNQPLTIEIHRSEKLAFQQQLNFAPSPHGFTATASGIYLSDNIDTIGQNITVTPDALPRTDQGYGSIQTLILTPSDLASLENAQTLALSHYLQSCKELLLINANTDVLNKLRSIAGCNGDAINLFQEKPKNEFRHPLPSKIALQALLLDKEKHDPIATLYLFFSCYLCILLLMLRATRKPAPLLIIPTLGAITLIAAWTLQENHTRLASWSEVESGSQKANFSALLSIEGVNSTHYNLQLSKAFGLPNPLNNKPVEVAFNRQHPSTEQLTVTTQPFSRDQYWFQGTLPIPHSLSLITNEMTPIVINHGDKNSSNAILSWQGRILSVPSLAPGRQWTPTKPDAIEISSTLHSMIRARTGPDSTALILPFTLQQAGLLPSHVQESGWLMIKPAT